MRKRFLFLCAVLLATAGWAQRYAFRNYTTHDGLVQTEITDITQDKRGAIWIGTRGGLSVFDGKAFANYDSQDLLQNLYINALLCDSAGVMWIATDNGLLKYDHAFAVFFKSSTGQKNSITSLATDSRNRLLFVCNNSAYLTDGKKVVPFPIDKHVDGNITHLSFDRDDNLWIATKDLGVYRKKGAQLTAMWMPFKPELMKAGLGLMKILGKQSRSPYFVTNFGTLSVKGDSLCYFSEMHPAFAAAKVGYATYVLSNGDSSFWVGGTMGFSKLNGNNATRFGEYNGFCNNSVSCLFTDKEKNLWIGCTFNGVYKLSNEALFQPGARTSASDLRHVSAINVLSNRSVLLATWGRGLFMLRGDSLQSLTKPPSMLYYITCLQQVGDKTFFGWFGKGLWQMDNRTQRISRVASFAEDEAVSGIQKFGDNLLVETLGHRAYLTDLQFRIKATTRLPDDCTLSVLGNAICRKSESGSVDMLDTALRIAKADMFPQINSRVTGLTRFGNSTLIGTFGQGLFVYNDQGELVKHMDKTSGLFTNIVTALLVDGNRLFVGSNIGLIAGDLPALQQVKLFKESEGMFTWECRANGLAKLPDGGLLIATTNGPFIYYADKDRPVVSGVLSISEIRYGKQCYSFSPVVAGHSLPNPIAYRDNDITIGLTAVSQRNPDDVVYHYRLQGQDSAWTTTTDPVAVFNRLAPGSYCFNAYISVGDFRSKPLSVQFAVAKPISGELWFQALLVLALAVVCWALLTVGNRIYQRYIRSRMMSRFEQDVAGKERLTTASVLQAGHQWDGLQKFLETKGIADGRTAAVLLQDVGQRIQLLWQREEASVADIHRHFDSLIIGYGKDAKIYHKEAVGEVKLPVPAVFHLLQLFSLYLVATLCQDPAAVFSLDSEAKAAGRVLFRFYTLQAASQPDKQCIFQFLKEAIEKQKPEGVAVDVIENLEHGNTLVAEITLQNRRQI